MIQKRLAGALFLAMLACAAVAQEPRLVSGEEAARHLIERTEPKYPSMAQLARIQGSVILRVTIDEQGRVAEAKPISGHPMLIEAAIPAVKGWKFAPFLDNGSPVPVLSQVQVDFTLEPGSERRPEYLQQEVKCTRQIFETNFSAGEPLCRKALETAMKLPRAFALEKMRAYGNAGMVAYELKKLPEALEDFRQQFDFAQQRRQPANPQMVRIRGNLAHTYLALGQLAEADAQFTGIEKSLDAARAEMQARQSQTKPEAFQAMEASYARNMRVVLEEHAAALRKLGKLAEAEALEQRAGALQAKPEEQK